jgi:predicted ester cyclase
MAHPDLSSAVRAFVDRLNAGDRGAVRDAIAAEFFTYAPAQDEPTATDTWSALADDLLVGIPDLHVTVDELASSPEGNGLSGQVTITGTHTGPLWGVPPTGAAIDWPIAVRVRPVGDRFAVNFDGVTTPILLGQVRKIELMNPPDQMHLPPRHPAARPPEFLLRMAFTGQVADRPCSHLDTIRFVDPPTDSCEQCVTSGDIWPALRMCMTCGFVGCCDTSRTRT